MFRSLFRFSTKSHYYEDAEKELIEVTDLVSEHQSYLVETDKTEFNNEHDRLQREISLYKAGESTAKPNIILDDCRAFKCKVTKTIGDRMEAYVRLFRGEVSEPVGVSELGGHQESDLPPATTSNHSNQLPNVKTTASLPETSADIDKTPFKPQSGVPSVTVNPRSGLPQSHHIPAHANLKQATSQATSGISREVDSMVMMGTNAKCPTLNIDSVGCTGAKILSHEPQVTQQVSQPVRPRRAVGRRAQQQPRNFTKGNYSSNGSMILCGSSVIGATLNVNATNSSGAVFHHDTPSRECRIKKDRMIGP